MVRSGAVSFAAVVLALSLGGTPAVAQVEVNTCGQTFSGRGFLSGDLDCTGFDGNAVTIGSRGGILDLKGFAITGGWDGVACLRSCKIIGPGTISDNVWDGVFAQRKVTVVNVTITNHIGRAAIENTGSATSSPRGRVKVFNSTLTGGRYGVQVEGSATVVGSTITGNVYGVDATRSAKIIRSTITGNNAIGVRAAQMRTSQAGHPPVCVRGKVMLKDSTVTGNNWLGCPPDEICADVVSCGMPRVRGTSTCETSVLPAITPFPRWSSFLPGDPWGVCALD